MKRRLGSGRISPPAGYEPATTNHKKKWLLRSPYKYSQWPAATESLLEWRYILRRQYIQPTDTCILYKEENLIMKISTDYKTEANRPQWLT